MISYAYTSNVTRDARLQGAVRSEPQLVIPSYVRDDEITAARNIVGGSGVEVGGAEIVWLDLNVDGRAWAKKAP